MAVTEGIELKPGDVGYLNSDGTGGVLYPAGTPEADQWHRENSEPHELEDAGVGPLLPNP